MLVTSIQKRIFRAADTKPIEAASYSLFIATSQQASTYCSKGPPAKI